jgi:hypothetical protein
LNLTIHISELFNAALQPSTTVTSLDTDYN